MVAISIIVSTRGNLTANDRPAAHMTAGVSVGVAINKTVSCNDDLTFSFAAFATRENKGNRLLSGQKNRADRSQSSTRIRRAHVHAAKRYLPSKVGRASVTGNCIFSFLEFWVFTRKDERT